MRVSIFVKERMAVCVCKCVNEFRKQCGDVHTKPLICGRQKPGVRVTQEDTFFFMQAYCFSITMILFSFVIKKNKKTQEQKLRKKDKPDSQPEAWI